MQRGDEIRHGIEAGLKRDRDVAVNHRLFVGGSALVP
jgi:hypothetical protein